MEEAGAPLPTAAVVDDDNVRVPPPFASFFAWLGPPRGYQLTRWLILRLLGFVYVFAFLGLIFQGPALLGSHGLTPIQTFVDLLHGDGRTFWDLPSLFMGGASDSTLQIWAWIGLLLSIAVLLGYANMPMLLALWFIYGSFERVGQLWFAFGWEIQLLETTLIAVFLAHPWDPRPLAARPPPVTPIVLMRWLTFRIMLGAGLIKLRGDSCWTDLTCLDFHFETQPIPNPLSPLFHDMPHSVLAGGVAFNHVVEVIAPLFVFGPRRLRLIAGIAMAAFQLVLILSGNLAFLNWLTLIPIIACFDDDALLRITPRRLREWLRARMAPVEKRDGRQLAMALAIALVVIAICPPLPAFIVFLVYLLALLHPRVRRVHRSPGHRFDMHQILVAWFAALVAIKSVPVVKNLASDRQAMNRDFDPLSIVNTYGAFGSVGDKRYELVIEGTLDDDPERATWREYELPCKPGDITRRPCILGPYHRRLDWLIWFSAMDEQLNDPWIVHFVWKLLDGDRTVRELIAVDPFDAKPPKWVRIRRYLYRFGDDTWWTRELVNDRWLQPVSKDTEDFAEVLARYRWPSPSAH